MFFSTVPLRKKEKKKNQTKTEGKISEDAGDIEKCLHKP